MWWHRGERRIVEYGSSFGAVRAAGIGRALRDTLVGLNADHLGRRAVTIFEALADAGVRTAAVNFTVYRGRTPHRSTVPFLGTVLGPERFFFYNLFQSERTGAGLSFRNRAAGTVDAYAAAVGRLVTRDGFDFLLLYLSDYDYASHAAGPDAATDVLARCDEAVGGLVRAAGGLDEFSPATRSSSSRTTASHPGAPDRAARGSLPPRAGDARARVESGRARGQAGVERAEPADARRAARRRAVGGRRPVSRGRGGRRPSRRLGVRFDQDGRTLLEGDGDPRPARRRGARAAAALACPNAGEVVVSAAGWEFEDLGGRHHRGGGSHGSLLAEDSLVPVLAVGLDGALPGRTVDLAPAVLAHFGVDAPAYAVPSAA